MVKMKKIFILFIFFSGLSFSQIEFIGYRFIKDPDVPKEIKRYEIVPIGEGGVFHIYIKNNSNTPVEIKNIKINGKNFSEIGEWIFRKRMDVSKWWNLYPKLIQPGKLGTLRIRYYKILNYGEKIKITLETNIGNFEDNFYLFESPLRLRYVGFSEDLRKIYLFVQNKGNEKVILKEVFLDDKKVETKWKKINLNKEEITIGEIDLTTLLPKGEYLIIRVKSDKKNWEANGSLRIFPSRFYFTAWMMGSGADIRDLKRIHFNLESNPPQSKRAEELKKYNIFSEISVLQDEPLGGGISPQEVSNKFLNAMNDKDIQYAIQLTGYGENITYSDIGDIHIHHHHPKEETEIVHKLNEPKTIWYLPQTTWNNWEGLDHEAKNKPRQWAEHTLDEQIWRTYESIGNGDKGLIWFIYCNLWNQSMNYWGGLEYDGTFSDPIIQGMINNPLLWRKVEEINGTFSILSDSLSISSPYYNEKTEENISVNCLICWNDFVVVTLVNNNYYLKQNRWSPFFTSKYSLEVNFPIPNWIKPEACLSIDYFTGIKEIKDWEYKDDKIKIKISELKVGKLIVILPSKNQINELIKKWEEISPWSKVNYNHLKYEEFEKEEKRNVWLLKDKRWRNFIKIKTKEKEENLIAKIPLKIGCEFKKGHIFDENSLEAIEVDEKGIPIGNKKYYFSYSLKLEEKWRYSEISSKQSVKQTGEMKIEKEENIVKIIKKSPFGPDYGCYWQSISFSDEWVSSDYPIIRFTYNLENCAATRILLYINFDLNGDKKRDGGTTLELWRQIPENSINKKGWITTELNWVKASLENKRENPNSIVPKYGNFWIQIIYDNEEKEGIESEIMIREIKFIGNNNLYILLNKENKKERYFYIYYNTFSKNEEDRNLPLEEFLKLGKLTECEYEQKIEKPSIDVEFKEKKDFVEVYIKPDATPEGIILKSFHLNGNILEEIIPEKTEKIYYAKLLKQNLKYIQIKVNFGDFLDKNLLYEYPSFRNITYKKEEDIPILKTIYDIYNPIYDLKIIDGKIIIGGDSIYAIDKEGKEIWKFNTEVPVKQIAKMGDRILGIIGKWEKETGNYKVSKLIILNKNGEKLLERSFSPYYIRKIIVSPDENKFALITWHDPKGLTSSCYIFDKEGNEINRFVCEGIYATEIKFIDNEKILIGNSPSGILSCYKTSGEKMFSVKLEGTNVPCISNFKNRIYAIGYKIYCLDEKGNKIWERECGIYPRVLSVSENGKYISTGTLDGTFSIFDLDGNLIKEIKFEDAIVNYIISDKDGFIFAIDKFSCDEKNIYSWLNWTELYKVKYDGEIVWKYKGEKRPFLDEPKIDKNEELIVISSYDGKIRRIK